jgi:hypothetical protein
MRGKAAGKEKGPIWRPLSLKSGLVASDRANEKQSIYPSSG